MNTATRTAVQYCLARGHTPLGIYNSWSGLLDDHVSELAWLHVDEWATRGGSELGTSRKLPDIDLEGVAKAFEKHRISALLVIGGFEAFSSLLCLDKARKTYSAFDMPMVHIPATVRADTSQGLR
jgi:6-phosphofructokinase 1